MMMNRARHMTTAVKRTTQTRLLVVFTRKSSRPPRTGGGRAAARARQAAGAAVWGGRAARPAPEASSRARASRARPRKGGDETEVFGSWLIGARPGVLGQPGGRGAPLPAGSVVRRSAAAAA